MTYFELMESTVQTNIFDFLEFTSTPARNNEFLNGDKVKIQFYIDEISYIEQCHPQLLEVGVIMDKKLDFYSVMIQEHIVEVPGEKLILV